MPKTIRFHLDESCRPVLADRLRKLGVDTTSSIEVGLLGATDAEQLAFCLKEGRVIFTHDADFLALHETVPEHAGIIHCRQGEYSLGDILRLLVLFWEMYEPVEMASRLEFL